MQLISYRVAFICLSESSMLSNQSNNQSFLFQKYWWNIPPIPYVWIEAPDSDVFLRSSLLYAPELYCCLNQKTYSTLLVLYLNTIGALPERSGEMPLASGLNFLPEYFWHGSPERSGTLSERSGTLPEHYRCIT